jgi:excinuclease UvrABC ATPase subunit
MKQKIIYSSPPKCKTCGKIPTSWDINLTDYECNQCTAERVGDNILNSILNQFNMVQVIKMTHSEKVEMYQKIEKDKLIEMLIEANNIIEQLSHFFVSLF